MHGKGNTRPSRLGRVLLAVVSATSYRSKHDQVDIVDCSTENFGLQATEFATVEP